MRPFLNKSSTCYFSNWVLVGFIQQSRRLGKVELEIRSITCWTSHIGGRLGGSSLGVRSLNLVRRIFTVGGTLIQCLRLLVNCFYWST